jgi:hypothetical protein
MSRDGRDKTQTTVERMARECVGYQLRMLHRVVTSIYEDELRPLELEVSRMTILAVTAKQGQALLRRATSNVKARISAE